MGLELRTLHPKPGFRVQVVGLIEGLDLGCREIPVSYRFLGCRTLCLVSPIYEIRYTKNWGIEA